MVFGIERKHVVISLLIMSFIFSLFGSTFAYLNWQTVEVQKTVIDFTLEENFYCSADGGGSITMTEATDAIIMPTTCLNTDYAIKREIKVKPTLFGNDITIDLDLNLDVNLLDSGLSNSQNFKYAFTTSDNSCTDGVIASGSFNGKTSGDKIKLLEKIYNQTSTDTYYLYIWLDAAETSESTMNQKFELSLSGNCEQIESVSQNAPVLDDGMIPVKIANDGTVTTVSSTDSSWYNYDNKEWANAVLVSSSSRSNYKGTTGKTVTQSDILAYYVWIPRYKYKIWDTTGTSSPQTIDIEFESKTASVSSGTTVDSWKTHPAFVFGDENLPGIWVGKFESTGDGTTPTILPNSASLVYQNVSTQFATSLKFAGGTQSGSSVSFSGNSTYGLTTNTDSHMMKNSEWGAVAYLSHSEYGVNTQIRINNFFDYDTLEYMTGCGASEEDAYGSETCEIQYGGASSYPQSTTGNITGVFDMSGGAWEYVMGNYNNTISYADFTTLPTSKYYDSYTSTDELTACNGGICYGHALSETKGWYDDWFYMAEEDWPWFGRGGGTDDEVIAGAFYADGNGGEAVYVISWRSVLVVR